MPGKNICCLFLKNFKFGKPALSLPLYRLRESESGSTWVVRSTQSGVERLAGQLRSTQWHLHMCTVMSAFLRNS